MNCERCNGYSAGATLCIKCEKLSLLPKPPVYPMLAPMPPWVLRHDGWVVSVLNPQRCEQVVFIDRDMSEDDRAKGNLITSAPEGYMLAYELIHGGGTPDSMQRAIVKAYQVLAKATGRK